MPFTYPTVTISSNVYDVYDDDANAAIYLAGAVSSQAVAWIAAASTLRKQSLVAATRWLDSGKWQGAMADVANDLQFPRTGLTYPNGQAVDSTTIPIPLINAMFELAAALVDNSDLRTEMQNPQARELRAGSASITFFRPPGAIYGAKDVQVLSFFPQNVMDLIGPWLQGSGTSTGPITTGTCKDDPLEDDFGLVHGL